MGTHTERFNPQLPSTPPLPCKPTKRTNKNKPNKQKRGKSPPPPFPGATRTPTRHPPLVEPHARGSAVSTFLRRKAVFPTPQPHLLCSNTRFDRLTHLQARLGRFISPPLSLPQQNNLPLPLSFPPSPLPRPPPPPSPFNRESGGWAAEVSSCGFSTVRGRCFSSGAVFATAPPPPPRPTPQHLLQATVSCVRNHPPLSRPDTAM